jgi:ribosomal protein S18 acetylase RimI-like enzyme
METAQSWLVTREDVRRFEDVVFDALATLMRATLAELPENPDGYAFFQATGLRAILSTNPLARIFCSAVGITQCPKDEIADCVRFFDSHGVRPLLRVPPDGFSPDRAQVLAKLGLRHTGFHAVLYAPIAGLPESATHAEHESSIAIEEVHDADRFEAFLDVQIRGWGIPESAVEDLKTVRWPWRSAKGHRSYLATVDGVPAAHAMLFDAGDIAYLSSANTLPAFRRRGLQTRLIRRRIEDARQMGKRIILGATDFESRSRTNMMRCGMHIAYTAAWWAIPKST